ncbi:helix-turn-helix domain-containing protein [Psychrosphaera sp. F3M07]|uniref:helix-turn-helix domain-containing protein n=1 Tax=Psychrosphaera sp. F3M07 TaxID=2841560 RepID=UPI001C082ECC|nr:helix-turn-helix domain-containing protein [Psychrosphaera sp. F3M07]MBU2918141.1 helix-turn-helix domain-containing protein [Psychrosphaera sp. F3M07]
MIIALSEYGIRFINLIYMLPISTQLILILSALGSINGFIVALYLWVQPSKNLSNRFLAAMLIMISIRTLKSVLYHFNPDIIIIILQIGLSACFLIGPLLYFFCLSHLKLITHQKVRWSYHLIALVSVITIIGIIFPYQQHLELWRNLLYTLINYVWLMYIVLSFIVISPKIKSITKQAKLTQDDIWLLSVFIGNAIIWLAYFTSSYTSYIAGALSFSFILFIACLLVLFKFKDKVIKIKYADKEITTEEADLLIDRLHLLMKNEELYKNSLISMPQVAKRLGISTPKFSQLLNDNLNKSFSLYINELRIEAAKSILVSNSNQTIETIAELCGFNSQSTFYSVFKKQTKLTPAKYKEQTLNL